MREFIAELADCGSVDDAFAAGIGEDPDGEQRSQRPDWRRGTGATPGLGQRR